MKKVAWIVFILLVIGLGFHFGRQPAPFPAGSASAARLQPGPLQVSAQPIHLIDRSRPTAANGDFAGAAERELEGKVWYPQGGSGAPYPLIVYSHGFTSDWHEGIYLAEHLASLGNVVVAVNYPLSNLRAPGGPRVQDVVNQPGDVTFIIDALLHRNQTPGDALAGLIDEKRIGVVGLSLGGMTTELVTFHPTLRDPRVAAALSIAGPTSMFAKEFFATRSVPFLMLAGDIDALIPYATNAAPVPEKAPGAALVTIAGGSHTGFAGPAAPLRWLVNPDAIGCFIVLRNIDVSQTQSWYKLLGTPEQGIDYAAKNELCQVHPLPQAMNVLRQQMITAVVVGSFFESVFAPQAQQRAAAHDYLREVLSSEVPEASVRM